MVSKTRQKERGSKRAEKLSEQEIEANETVVDRLIPGENPSDEYDLILDTTLLEPSRQDNHFEVLSQRVDDKIKSGWLVLWNCLKTSSRLRSMNSKLV